MNEIKLTGCCASSLSSYLKALGILRLITNQLDSAALGYWDKDSFVLKTKYSRDDLAAYFLTKYSPSPILSPWNGRAGFLEGEDDGPSTRKGTVTISRVERSSGSRFSSYRNLIAAIRNVSVIAHLDRARARQKALDKKKKVTGLDEAEDRQLKDLKKQMEELKGDLLLSLRAELPDEFLPWIDACFTLAASDRKPDSAPLLGSGGNEGSMDFSINHIGYLLDLIDANSDEPTPLAKRLIANALYDDTQFLESSANIGFLDALATGGVNMTNGFDASASGNIWSSILTMEGTVLFASATTKRHESSATGKPTFPFAVSPVLAGEGSIGANESPRPELWLPTWHAPASIMELSRLFSEGRTTLGKNIAQNGIDMLQALSLLGVDRGITAFERYGIYERRGQGTYVTAHLGSYRVPEAQSKNWIIGDLGKDYWLQKFRSFTQGKGVANHFLVLRKQLEDKFFALSGYEPSPLEVQAILVLLGEIQSALAVSRRAKEEKVNALPLLSAHWIHTANDKTPAFRIARALAGLHGSKEIPLPLCVQLFPVHPRYPHKWIDDANNAGNDAAGCVRVYTDTAGSLPHLLRNLLDRRLWLAEKLEMNDKPLLSSSGATLDDIATFLQDDSMDRRIAALLPGLSLCKIPEEDDRSGGNGSVSAAFALLKLCLTPDSILRSLGVLRQDEHVPVPPGILAQLASGHKPERAVLTAWRRIHASGLNPVFSHNALPTLDGISAQRAAAALLIPLHYGAYGKLARSVLKKTGEQAGSPAA